MVDPKSTGCYKEFPKCCFCIPLHIGAHILGILAVLGAIYGVIDMVLYFGNPQW